MRFLLGLLLCLILATPAVASNRLSQQVARTSQCLSGDWGATPGCGWLNVEAYAPVFFDEWSYGSWGPLTVHNPDSGAVVQNMTDMAIPDFAAQGPWRTTERPEASDLAAVFIDYTHPQPRLCEAWVFDWRWWTGPTAYHGGCMDYNPGETARAFPFPMGSQASGLRYVDGVVRVQEWQDWLKYGTVPNHELQVAVPLACKSFRAPANRSDGNAWASPADTDCIEYGSLFKLPKGYATPYYVWSPFVRLMIEMAKKKGLRVSDQTGYSVVVRVENPGRAYAPWGDGDPYNFNWDDRYLRQFPWDKLVTSP